MALGRSRVASVCVKNTEQAQWLAAEIQRDPALELCAPVALNIVCFRYRGRAGAIDDLNKKILIELQESGFCVMSPYQHRERFVLRVCLSNHRTRRADLEALLTEVVRLGRRLEDALPPEPPSVSQARQGG